MELKFSIIIPHFESVHFLINVLAHLSSCAGIVNSEIIVVDDSSSSPTFEYLNHRVLRDFSHLKVKILRWPEIQFHSDKTKIFRAGASRHWGVLESQFDDILFLDSDILVPRNFLFEVQSSLQNFDLVQFVRMHIPTDHSHEGTKYSDFVNSSALFVEEHDYWSSFFDASNWMSLSHFWKYTCTYGLALKKSTYAQTGGFHPRFDRYGFEDTHLGYRVYKLGGRFLLNKTPVLHLTQTSRNTQSLFFKYQKQNRIQPMAKVLYELNPDSEVFDVIGHLL